jgi:hypothetical protein
VEFGDGRLVCGRSRSLRNNRCAPNWWLSKLRGGDSSDGDGDDSGWGSKASLLERSLGNREDAVVAISYGETQQLLLRALLWKGAVVGDARGS